MSDTLRCSHSHYGTTHYFIGMIFTLGFIWDRMSYMGFWEGVFTLWFWPWYWGMHLYLRFGG